MRGGNFAKAKLLLHGNKGKRFFSRVMPDAVR